MYTLGKVLYDSRQCRHIRGKTWTSDLRPGDTLDCYHRGGVVVLEFRPGEGVLLQQLPTGYVVRLDPQHIATKIPQQGTPEYQQQFCSG